MNGYKDYYKWRIGYKSDADGPDVFQSNPRHSPHDTEKNWKKYSIRIIGNPETPLYYHLTRPSWGQIYFGDNLFSNSCNLLSSLTVKAHVSHSYRTTTNIVFIT